jgi:hypothetical protein
MKKDTFYFPHDYNAVTDVKILFMRQQLGMEGYGIYWFLIESLANAGGRLPMKIIPVLAMQIQVTEVKVKAVIESFELFEVVENQFFSVRLNEHLQVRNLFSESGKRGALARWNKVENDGVANRGAISVAIEEGNAKERKGKEKKEKEIHIGEFLDFAKEEFLKLGLSYENYEYAIKSKFETWESQDWKDGHGKPIKNWKLKLKNVIPFLKPIKFSALPEIKINSSDLDFENYKKRQAELGN